jgi:hypothetical protein
MYAKSWIWAIVYLEEAISESMDMGMSQEIARPSSFSRICEVLPYRGDAGSLGVGFSVPRERLQGQRCYVQCHVFDNMQFESMDLY